MVVSPNIHFKLLVWGSRAVSFSALVYIGLSFAYFCCMSFGCFLCQNITLLHPVFSSKTHLETKINFSSDPATHGKKTPKTGWLADNPASFWDQGQRVNSLLDQPYSSDLLFF